MDKLNLPFIKFKEDWLIQLVPPFGGADVRFIAKKGNNEVSVYFDSKNRLGFMDAPYWEAYPLQGDAETARFFKDEIEGLIDFIEDSLNKDNK